MEDKTYYTVPEAAKILHLSNSHVSSLYRAGKIKARSAYKTSYGQNFWEIEKAELDRYLYENPILCIEEEKDKTSQDYEDYQKEISLLKIAIASARDLLSKNFPDSKYEFVKKTVDSIQNTLSAYQIAISVTNMGGWKKS